MVPFRSDDGCAGNHWEEKAFHKQFSLLNPPLESIAWQRLLLNIGFTRENKNARDAIRTHEPLQEWILSPSELAGLSYPRTIIVYIFLQSGILSPAELTPGTNNILTL